MKKRIFAILMAVIMVVSLVAGAIPALAAEDEGVTIRVHYHRDEPFSEEIPAEDKYKGWSMWFWDLDGITSLEPPYELEAPSTGEDEVVATIKVKTGTCKVGYIARYGDWEKKDIDWDQFINITGVLSGTIDFYIQSGVSTQPNVNSTPTREQLEEMEIDYNGRKQKVMVLNDDVVTGVVVTQSAYKEANRDGKPELTLQLSSKLAEGYDLNATTFVVNGPDGTIPLAEPTTNSDGSVKQPYRVAGQYVYLTLGEPLKLDKNYSVTFEGRNYGVNMPDFYSREAFEDEFTYTGNDLGATYTKENTKLRVWAPTADSVNVLLYSNGDIKAQTEPDKTVPMTKDVNGTWIVTLDGDMNGTYYTYQVTLGAKVNEACDPYARTTGVNGNRAMIIDLDSTDPEGWANDKDPNYDFNFTDHVIYELHVRDLSSDPSSGIKNVGKFLGLIEKGTKNSNGISTGLDHMVDLGITAIHLLPSYDFSSVDESKLDDESVNHFNWGYDPKNYNVPEGSYSTDPYNGAVRVKEMKQMIKGLHDAGISVIMDVVYNHVADGNGFCFNKLVPGYFTRPNSNGSGCGNDVASERSMVSKYIIDSVTYWADEYHIDGFRFDLVGLIDTDTINGVIASVRKTHPNVKFYGEGWSLGTNVTKQGYTMTTQTNSAKTPEFAFFSDTIRDLIKGRAAFGEINKGYINGGGASNSALADCFKGMPGWCSTPSQSINYVSCHDNTSLYDHNVIVTGNAPLADRVNMNKLAVAFYMSAQGIPLFQAGEEMLRTKPMREGEPDTNDRNHGFYHNSYNAGDDINSLKWDELNSAEHQDVYEFYKGMIAFRKAHPALRLTTADAVHDAVEVISGLPANVAAYSIKGGVNGETAEGIFAIFNANAEATTVKLPAGEWNICVNDKDAGTASLGTASGSVSVAGRSAMILVKGNVESGTDDTTATQPTTGDNTGNADNSGNGIIIALIIANVIVLAVIVVIAIKKFKK